MLTVSELAVDSAEFLSWKDLQVTHATTNPSIIFQAAKNPFYRPLLEEAITYGRQKGQSRIEELRFARLKTYVNFGKEILSFIPGHVSTQVDPRIAYDTKATINEAEILIDLYEEIAIPRERVLIKIPATWEGLLAAEILEKKSIACNMTTILTLSQAIAAAQMGASCIAPYVNKVSFWFESMPEDMGVCLVKKIFHYYISNQHDTLIMAASFKTLDQVYALVGCPIITLKPDLLRKVINNPATFPLQLHPQNVLPQQKILMDQSTFHKQFQLKELFQNCINQFIQDTKQLELIL